MAEVDSNLMSVAFLGMYNDLSCWLSVKVDQ